ncbi:MAG: sterol desaturase family protein [Putridiphycobacter sp.]
MIYNALVFIGTFIFMEGVAWFTHKYIMHGFLWHLHEDHHVPNHKSKFEKNDYFFLIFATPGILFTILGIELQSNTSLFIGLGITFYGLIYFLIHEIFIHQRIKIFRNSNNKYLRSLRRAHKIHHKHIQKEDGECFGMLIVPFKYFKQEFGK